MSIQNLIEAFKSGVPGLPAIIAIIVAIVLCAVLCAMSKNANIKMDTKSVVAIGIGAALYAALSVIVLPIGPNTSFRLAIAIVGIFGALFGPVVGFLVGFIGHALNDALMWGSVWWSWVFLSAILGLFGGLIKLDTSFDVLSGKVEKRHVAKMYIYSVIGMLIASIFAYFGDVFLYGEPAEKVFIQIILASSTNLAVIGILGIPVVIGLAKMKKKNQNLTIDE